MKERRITLRLSGNEYSSLLSMAAEDPDCLMKKSGRASVSSYIRKCIFYSGDHPENLREEIRNLNYQVRKAGININQAVHRINAGKGSRKDIDTICRNQSRIEGLLSRVLDLLQENLSEGQ
ncbi:MAG: plasmid mobilization relaxosome protein MobC [Oscillospiraceae bacterium]|nr:plasmid mobilization relaxosome protein MobC [Oscillospiraceae bacterium]